VDEALISSSASAKTDAGEAVLVEEVRIHDAAGRPSTEFDYGDPLRVTLHVLAREVVQSVQCSVTVRGDYGPLFTATSDTFPCWRQGAHELECTFENLPLLPGLYRLEVQVRHAGTAAWAVPQTLAAFRVRTDLAAFGSASPVGTTKSRGGFLAVAYDWRLQSSAGDQALSGLRLPTIISPRQSGKGLSRPP
jgi:hypothetical protein